MSILTPPSAPLSSESSLTGSIDSLTSFDNECVVLNHDELTVIRHPRDSKFPVYITSSSNEDKYYIIKIFPYENDAISPYYEQESRFKDLNHEHIIEVVHTENLATFLYDNRQFKVSYIMSEYAQYGDLFNAVNRFRQTFSEKLIRTYFRQLIEGLEYLHIQGVSHLDIKPENLLLKDDYTLKIIDFDLSHVHGDPTVSTKGTKNYRAPELFNQSCSEPELADMYSAGVTLFFMKTKGCLPYMEDKFVKGVDMAVLKEDNPARFWEMHCEMEKKASEFFSESFKSLFISMTKFKPEERATISDVKDSEWYNGEIYTKEELYEFMQGKL